MARPLILSRDEAEFLVDLIEASGAYLDLAAELREQWGMVSRERELEARKENPLTINSDTPKIPPGALP